MIDQRAQMWFPKILIEMETLSLSILEAHACVSDSPQTDEEGKTK
jgi:hypothetical protein